MYCAMPPHPQTALQLLETSIHEKQDSVVALRKQLEELKAANLKMQNQLKVSDVGISATTVTSVIRTASL